MYVCIYIYLYLYNIGVASMYMGWGADGSVWFASEMKALVNDCKKIEQFPPGHYWSHKTKQLHRCYPLCC